MKEILVHVTQRHNLQGRYCESLIGIDFTKWHVSHLVIKLIESVMNQGGHSGDPKADSVQIFWNYVQVYWFNRKDQEQRGETKI